MKILITGAAGFVGRHLTEALKRQPENKLYAFVLKETDRDKIDLPRENVFKVDITNHGEVDLYIERIKPDIVYHLAAQSSVALSWKHPALTYSVNITGTANLLEALSVYSQRARVILIGSSEQYGTTTEDEQPVRENHSLTGGNPYSVSKMAQEAAAELFLKNSDLQIIRVRAFNHIGAGQETTFVIPDWCSQVISMEKNLEEKACLKVGNVKVKRDFTDVRDIVRAYILLGSKGVSGEIYNVGSGVSHSLEEVLAIIKKLSSRDDITWTVDKNRLRPTDIMELRADISKLKSATGWSPEYSLEDSVGWIMEEMRKSWSNSEKHV